MHRPVNVRRSRWRRRWARAQFVVIVVIVAALAPSALADEVNLKGSVRLAPGAGGVTLADVAEISGADAERFADLVIAPVADPSSVLEISVADVRRALTEAGVHWGRVQLNGGTVIVRPTGPQGAAPPLLVTPASIEAPTAEVRRAVAASGYESGESLVDLMTLRGAVARTIIAGMRLPPESVRLTFDQRDAPVLDADLQDHRFEIQPLSRFDSDRIDVGVRSWEGDRVTGRYTLSVHPAVRQDVVMLTSDLHRGDVVHEDACTVEPQWLPPIQAATMCSLIEAVGRVADTTIKAGEPLKYKHVRRDVLIRRGDRVVVRCLVGGVVISLEAEAKDDGAEGERVELRKLGERDTFFGTVTGPGSAVINLSRS